jgi:hypothetical protein
MIFRVTIDAMFNLFALLAGFFPYVTQRDQDLIDFIVSTVSNFQSFLEGAAWWFPVEFAWQLLLFALVIESIFTGLFILVRFFEIIRVLARP